MGPWSADLPDVSPPEKQPACQRGRLFKHTLRRARLCARAASVQKLRFWLDMTGMRNVYHGHVAAEMLDAAA